MVIGVAQAAVDSPDVLGGRGWAGLGGACELQGVFIALFIFKQSRTNETSDLSLTGFSARPRLILQIKPVERM